MSSRNKLNAMMDAHDVLAVLRSGGTLTLTHTRRGDVWFLSDGTPVQRNIAQQVIANRQVQPSDDALFADCHPQTYLWCRSRRPE
jgi:hypothetical protein